MLSDVRSAADFHDPTQVYHRDAPAPGEVFGKGEVVGDENDRDFNVSRMSMSMLRIEMRIDTSTMLTASSATMTLGFVVRERAMATRCR